MTDIEQRYAQWKARKADADEAVERQYQAWLKKRKRTAFTDDDHASHPISIFRKDQDTAQNWYQKSADTVNEIYQYYSDWKPRDEQKYQYFQNTTNSLLSEADKWRAQFAGNDEALRAIDDVASALATTNENLPKSYDYWAQWDTERDYNNCLRQQELNAMSSEELEAARKASLKIQKDKDILQELMLSNMPYNREYAEQDGKDMAIYDEIEKKRQYISEKYGVHFTENPYENNRILMDLTNIEEIAYTTAAGQSVTWDSLHKKALLEEDLNSRFEAYAMNEDWEEKSKAINTFADTESDSQIVKELTLSRIPNDWESAKANGVEKAAFDEVKKKRQYISEKYGIQFEEGPYASDSGLIDLMTKLERQEGEWDTFDFLPYLNYREKAVLSYIYKTEGRTAALDWHNYRRDIYQARANADISANWAAVGEDHPFWGSVGSVALSLGSGAEYVTDLFKYVATGEEQYNALALASSSIRSGVMDSVDWEIGKWDVFDFLYSTGMSFIDSYAAGKVGAIFGKSAGMAEKALEKTAGGIGGTVLGLGAAAQATNDALSRGMSQKQAFWHGIVSGTFEGIFEKWSIGKFTALQEVASTQGKEIAKNIAKSMLVNASDEVATEVANVVYDVLFNGEFSQYETLIRQYVASGMSESEAKAKAAQEIGKQVLESGASGLLMGAGFGIAGNRKAITNNMMTAGKSIAQNYRVGKTTIANSDMDVLRALSGDSGVRYSIKKTSSIPYNEQLMQIENAKLNGSNSLYIGRVFSHTETGFSDAPFAMNQSDYRKSRRSTAKNESRSSHGVSYSFFEEMPQNLSLAPMFIDNGTKVSIVTPYKMDDTKGADSYVIVGVWRDQAMENDIVNQIKSVYPLDNFYDRMKAAAEAGKLVVTNRNKAEQMLATIGIQTSEVSRILNLAKSRLSQQEENVKDTAKTEDVTQDIMNSYGQSPKFQFLRTSSVDSIRNSHGNVKARGNGGVKYAFKGYAEDGKGIYESNFPKGTPKKAKGEKILEYIQNVWSKKPITLRVEDGNHTRLIKAQFDPTYDAEHGQRSDASKLMGGNRHGTSSEQRVTLDLADDYYQLAEDARYNYSKEETGKETATHKDVKRWHYFVNDIYFAEYSSDTLVPYTVSINIKENPDGNYFYSFSAERTEKNGESPTQRTLHAVVNSSENTTANGKLSTDSIRNSRGNVKARGKGGVYYGYQGQRLNKLHLTAAQRVAVDFSERLAKKWGMTFYFYESQTDIFGRRIYQDKNGNWVQAEDGFYDPSDGSIHIDLNAGAYGQGAILFTVAHELTHHIQQWSPDAYHKLCDILTQGYLGAGQPLGIHVQLRQQLAQEACRELTYKEAYDEVMAHSLESVLADGKVMQLLEQIEAEDKSLAARVRRFFRDVAQLIWETVDTYWGLQPDSPEGRMVQQMKKLGAELEDAFAYGLYQAGQKFSQAGKSAAGNSSAGIQYAVREAFSSELQTWFDSTTHEERKVSGKRFLIGTTTDVLKSIGVKDYKIYFGGAKIDKILTGNSSMTLDTIKDAVMLLEDPILIMKSLTVENSIVLFGEVYTSGNKPVMISVLLDPTTKSGSVLDYAVITSAYGRRKSNLQHLVNNSEIYYVNEQKNRTDKWLKALGLQLPSALTKYGSINSIHNADKDVKMRDSLKVVSKKSEAGDPAKKFPATRPFAVEQDSLDENIPYSEQTVKANDSAQYRYSARQDLRQKNALAAAIRADVVHAHEAFLQEMTSRGIDQRNAKLAASALIDAAYIRATQRQVDFLRYMRTESPYAAQYNAALEAVFPGSTGTVTTAPAVGTDAYSGPTLGVSSVEDNAHTGPQATNVLPYDTNTPGENTVMQEIPLDGAAETSKNVDDFQTKVLEKSPEDDTIEERYPKAKSFEAEYAGREIITDGSHMENGKPKPNTVFLSGEHGYLYETDSLGRIIRACTDHLKLKLHQGRLRHVRQTLDKQAGDHAGHLFGDQFGGSEKLDNLVSQARDVNKKEFFALECEWKNALKAGKEVAVDIQLEYGDGMRPTAFVVTYYIDGNCHQESFANTNGIQPGKNP